MKRTCIDVTEPIGLFAQATEPISSKHGTVEWGGGWRNLHLQQVIYDVSSKKSNATVLLIS